MSSAVGRLICRAACEMARKELTHGNSSSDNAVGSR